MQNSPKKKFYLVSPPKSDIKYFSYEGVKLSKPFVFYEKVDRIKNSFSQ